MEVLRDHQSQDRKRRKAEGPSLDIFFATIEWKKEVTDLTWGGGYRKKENVSKRIGQGDEFKCLLFLLIGWLVPSWIESFFSGWLFLAFLKNFCWEHPKPPGEGPASPLHKEMRDWLDGVGNVFFFLKEFISVQLEEEAKQEWVQDK